MTHIISLACLKGGVGKTTATASLGGLLASSGQRTLLIDLDSQHNLTKTFVDIDSEDFDGRTIFDAFSEYVSADVDEADDVRLPILHVRENLDIVPSDRRCSYIDMQFITAVARESILKNLLDEIKGEYDWILIDTPPSLGIRLLNALTASKNILIPITCDSYAVDGLKDLKGEIAELRKINRKLSILGVFISRFNGQRSMDRALAGILENEPDWKKHFLATKIPENTTISHAPVAKTDINSYAPSSSSARGYRELLAEILERVNA